MKAKLAILALGAILVGCGESEPNVNLSTYDDVNSMFSYRFVRAEITATEDDVTVTEVIFNRGNCGTQNTHVSGKQILPIDLKFGETFSINSRAGCVAAEVEIVTNAGSWVWNYN